MPSVERPRALFCSKEVRYITERAVFALAGDGLVLIEVAPGVDVERDILARMGFRPRVADDLRTMDRRLYNHEPMGLAADFAAGLSGNEASASASAAPPVKTEVAR